MIGIYKFTNKLTGEAYIGQSTNVKKRYNSHLSRTYNKNNFEQTYFHDMLRHYGFHNFEFEVLEECSVAELDEKEKYYISYYNTLYPNGYNKNPGGSSPTHYYLDQDTVDSIIDDLRNTNLREQDIADKYGVHINTVSQINVGNSRHSENLVYPIRNGISRRKHYCKQCGKQLSEKTKSGLCYQCYHELLKKDRPSKEELYNLLLSTSFIDVGKMYNVSDNAVRKWCDTYNIPRHSSYYRQVLS